MRRQKARANSTTVPRWVAFTGLLLSLILTPVTAPAQKANFLQSGWQATSSCDAVPVYSRMSTDSSKLRLLKKGEPVVIDLEIIGADGAWCSVREQGQKARRGYVRSECLEWERPVATATRPVESPATRSSANFDIETFQGAEVITPKRPVKNEMKEEVDRAVDAKLNGLLRMSQLNPTAPPEEVEYVQQDGLYVPFIPSTFGQRRPAFRRSDGRFFHGIPGQGIPPLGNGLFGSPVSHPFPGGGFVRITGGGFSHRR